MSRIPLFLLAGFVAAPSLAFLATHMASPIVGWGAAATLTASLALAARLYSPENDDRVDFRVAFACTVAALVLCLLGGQTHLFFANDDWLVRDAVLADLVARPWPVEYERSGQMLFLRAPLGMYLVPALAGKVGGLGVAHVVLLLQNTVLIATLFYVFASLAQNRAHKAWLLGCFVLFSGWDIIGQAIAEGLGFVGRSTAFPAHLENWNIGLQYSSHVTQIFWVPNHAIAGWACVAGYLYWRAGRIPAGSFAVIVGLCAMWSPLAVLGAVPFVARAGFRDLAFRRLTLRSLAALALATAGLAPVLAYLVTDSQVVARGFARIDSLTVTRYTLFVVLEVFPFLVLLCALSLKGTLGRSEVAIVAASLLLIPFYDIGTVDFVMRASIPALAVLALLVGANSWPGAGGARAVPLAIATAFLAIGAVTPVYEIGRALVTPAFAVSRCDIIESVRQSPFAAIPTYSTIPTYLARTDEAARTGSLLALTGHAPAARSPERCWPDRGGDWVLYYGSTGPTPHDGRISQSETQ